MAKKYNCYLRGMFCDNSATTIAVPKKESDKQIVLSCDDHAEGLYEEAKDRNGISAVELVKISEINKSKYSKKIIKLIKKEKLHDFDEDFEMEMD